MASQQMLLGAGGKTDPVYVDDVYHQHVYSGNSSGSTSQAINTGFDLAADGGLVWSKRLSQSDNHYMMDSERSNGSSLMYTNSDIAPFSTSAIGLTTVPSSTGYTAGNSIYINGTGWDFGSWTFKRHKGFFDIVTWTGNGSDRTIAHSLGCVPGAIWVKRTDTAYDWRIYHVGLETDANNAAHYNLEINNTDLPTDSSNRWQDTLPTSAHFSLGTNSGVNANGATYVAYLFAGGDSTASTARSCDFSGSNYLELDDHADFHFGSGNFTLECWVKGQANGNNRNILGQWSNGEKSWSMFWGAANQGHSAWGFKYSSDKSNETQISDILLNDNQWHHIAVVRDGNDLELYRDGTLRKRHDISSVTLADSAAACRIANDGWDSPLDCHISNVRVVKGTAVYTSSFRVPTEPLTNITNTKLLCCNGTTPTFATVQPGYASLTNNGSVTSSLITPFNDPAGFMYGTDKDQDIIKCGHYTGNGSNAGPEIHLGWEPQWLLIKNASSTNSTNWFLFDSLRGWSDSSNEMVFPNLTNAEYDNTTNRTELTPTGFKVTTSYAGYNEDNSKFVYMAIRRPDALVGKPPSAGTNVFGFALGNTDAGIPNFSSNFVVDYAMLRQWASVDNMHAVSRLTGKEYWFTPTSDYGSDYNGFKWNSNVGWYEGNAHAASYMSWMWKRYAGMDVVTYTGDDMGGRQIPHNLSKTPEMIWLKTRSHVNPWMVYHKGLNGGTNPSHKYLRLNTSGAEVDADVIWSDTEPTATHFTIGSHSYVNADTYTYVAMLFASVDGISKCGFYTGSSSAQTITLGFQPRLIIIKRTDGIRSWNLFDTYRSIGPGSTSDWRLTLDDTAANDQGSYLDLTSDGMTLNGGNIDVNNNGYKYIYYCHA